MFQQSFDCFAKIFIKKCEVGQKKQILCYYAGTYLNKNTWVI